MILRRVSISGTYPTWSVNSRLVGPTVTLSDFNCVEVSGPSQTVHSPWDVVLCGKIKSRFFPDFFSTFPQLKTDFLRLVSFSEKNVGVGKELTGRKLV